MYWMFLLSPNHQCASTEEKSNHPFQIPVAPFMQSLQMQYPVQSMWCHQLFSICRYQPDQCGHQLDRKRTIRLAVAAAAVMADNLPSSTDLCLEHQFPPGMQTGGMQQLLHACLKLPCSTTTLYLAFTHHTRVADDSFLLTFNFTKTTTTTTVNSTLYSNLYSPINVASSSRFYHLNRSLSPPQIYTFPSFLTLHYPAKICSDNK